MLWLTDRIFKATSLVNSSSSFQYDEKTRTFHQNQASNKILQQMLRFNKNILSQLTTTSNYTFARNELAAGSPLDSLLQVGITDETLASAVLAVVFEELGKQTE
jgi:small subunit ribosomal protein S29